MRNRMGAWALAAAVVAIAGLAAPARAAVVLDTDLETLAREADVVVVARVDALRPFQHGGRILTEATLVVIRTLKGPDQSVVTITLPGGEIGGIGQWVPGAPRLSVGQEHVLFLARGTLPAAAEPGTRAVPAPQPRLFVMGLSLGLYRIATDPRTGVRSVQPDVGDLSLVRRLPDGSLTPPRPATPPAPEALDRFLSRVQRAIDSPAAPESRP